MLTPLKEHRMRIGCRATMLLAISGALVACGGGGSDSPPPRSPESIEIDYSALRVPESRDGALRTPTHDEELLSLLRNGLRLSLTSAGDVLQLVQVTASADAPPRFSTTTQQVFGVDEPDLVKYDGRHLFIVRPELVPSTGIAPWPQVTRNVLSILRTNPANATTTPVATFTIDAEQTDPPMVYLLQNELGHADALAAVSHDMRFWAIPFATTTTLPQVIEPDTTRVHLLDVSDPYNVRQTWKLEIDGWLRTSRKIGNTLYLVTSFHPRVTDLVRPAATPEQREANERRIRSAQPDELLPQYRINDASGAPLVKASDCVIAADHADVDAYQQLLVVTAVDLRERRVTDSTCLSTNMSAVYVSTSSLYVAGFGTRASDGAALTILHKFGLATSSITYAATGAVEGHLGWTNPSYYMDERGSDLRIVTSQSSSSGNATHRLSILRQSGPTLHLLSTLPNTGRPAPIGKPGEIVHAVRFVAERAYIVTARAIDPLYVVDVTNPNDPFIAGELEIPGFSTYLHPLDASLVASVGRQTDATGFAQGVKVELFDVSEPDRPRSVGLQVFGHSGSWSEAITNPHAITFLPVADDTHRIALPIDVFETPDPTNTGRFSWTYSGLHLLEVRNASSGSPLLHFQGAIRTAEPSNEVNYPPHAVPERGVLHNDSVFAIYGDEVRSRLWQEIAGLHMDL
jgi:uncharacterized secreted protein with C-terminal beta-propeller domain